MSFPDWMPPSIRLASTTLALGAGEVLYAQGSPTVAFFEVLSGQMRLTRPSITGKRVSMHVARPGDFLGEASLFFGNYHCEAAALVPSEVRVYPKDKVLAEFESAVDFAKAYAVMLARGLMAARVRIERLSLHSARDRVWHFLVLNASAVDGTFMVKGPLKDLATELGLTHEVLYRTLARMESDGEIQRSESIIRLINLQ